MTGAYDQGSMWTEGGQQVEALVAGSALPGFDDLFPVGLCWPGVNPLLMLIVGAQGAGKTTMALQLATGARLRSSETAARGESVPRRGRCVLYYTPDDTLPRVLEKPMTFRMSRNAGIALAVHGLDSGLKQPHVFAERTAALFARRLTQSLEPAELHGQIFRDAEAICQMSPVHPMEFFVVIDSVAPLRSRVDHLLALLIPGMAALSGGGRPFPNVIILTQEEQPLGRSPYLTDVHIQLAQGTHDEALRTGYCDRYVQVVKTANSPHARGVHTFHIRREGGMEIFASLQMQAEITRMSGRAGQESGEKPSCARDSSYGVPNFDTLIPSDVHMPAPASYFLYGPSGTMKTPQGMYFATREVLSGPALFVSLHARAEVCLKHLRGVGRGSEEGEGPAPSRRCRFSDSNVVCSLRDCIPFGDMCPRAKDLGKVVCVNDIDPDVVEKSIKGRCSLLILHTSPYFMSASTFVSDLRRIIACLEAKNSGRPITRFVLDGIGHIPSRYPRLADDETFLSVLLEALRGRGCTSLFIEDADAASGDTRKASMTQMADNVFMMTSASAGQHVHVLLEAQKLANEVHGQRLLYDLERLKGGGIWAVNATHKYSRAGNGELVPAKVRLYLNATTDAHRRFNERLSRAFEPGAELMDEHYALERGASYRRQIMALRFRQQEAAILAVDHVSRGMPDILEHFCDLTESTTQLRIQEMHGIAREPCYLGKPGTPGRSLRLVPVAVDLSVVLFSSELASSESMPVEMQDIVRSIVKHRDDKTLPCVEVGAFIRAAKAFGSKPRDGVRFFGFCNVRDSQHYVPLMIEWLQANGVLAVDVRRKQLSVSAAKWVPALLDFAPVYLAGGAGRGLGGMSSSPVKSEERFIFYRTWHSRAFSDPSCERLIPVRIGKKWRATRGGWYWGILDTGAGRQTAMEVLSHAVSQEMVVHKIAQRVYLPPIDELLRGGPCGSTIYNRRLMAYAYEKAWSRLDVRGYHEVAPLAYDFFHSYIQRLNDLCGGGKVRWQDVRPAVKQWLEGQVEYLAESVQTVQQRLTKK